MTQGTTGLTLWRTQTCGETLAIACSPESAELALCHWRQVSRVLIATGKTLARFIGHASTITCMRWSPSGKLLATGSVDESVRVWDCEQGRRVRLMTGDGGAIVSVAWSSSGEYIASADSAGATYIWASAGRQSIENLPMQAAGERSLLWSQGGDQLFIGGRSGEIHVWDVPRRERVGSVVGHRGSVLALDADWQRNVILSGGQDRTIRLWDLTAKREIRRLEGHTSDVVALALSPDGRLLASQSSGEGASILLWRTDTWEMVASLPCPRDGGVHVGWTALDGKSILITTAPSARAVHFWQVDTDLLIASSQAGSVQYTNARVVLMGDTGVGKTALGLVLSGQPFAATSSTHNRHVWTLDDRVVPLDDHRQEQREALLWDLGGQPGYRIIHQLYLSDIAVALVVFTAQSVADPFAGVMHWDRALHQAQRVSGTHAPLAKMLVAARIDVGGTAGGFRQAEELAAGLGYTRLVRTSAKEGVGIDELRTLIAASIPWDALPKVSSTELFQRIKGFLLQEKAAGHILATTDDLFRAYIQAFPEDVDSANDGKDASGPTRRNLRIQFETCIGLVEARDLIRRLSFGGLVLLQPEVLDAYASALVTAAGEAPDGLGSILEEEVEQGRFFVPLADRLPDTQQERLLLVAMREDMLRHELTLRVRTDAGTFLVFPSQSSRTYPGLAEGQRRAIVFTFEGSIDNLYATLIVRLAHSGLFTLDQVWRNAVTFTASAGGLCGLELKHVNEASAELTLVFDARASEETRYHFDEYVAAHLQRNALPESIRRHRIFVCMCGESIAPDTARKRRERGLSWLNCPVCETSIDLRDGQELLASPPPPPRVASMDRQADRARDNEAIRTTAMGRRAVNDYDVFLCYNSKDRDQVRWLAERLVERNISPWFDEWALKPGSVWQRELEAQISRMQAVAVVLGTSGIGPWQDEEQMAFLDEFKASKRTVIPVMLPTFEPPVTIPPFLKNRQWVDFRKVTPDPLDQLIWGITGERP